MASKPEEQPANDEQQRVDPRRARGAGAGPGAAAGASDLAQLFGAGSGGVARAGSGAVGPGGRERGAEATDDSALAALFARRPEPVPTRPVAEGAWWEVATAKPVQDAAGGGDADVAAAGAGVATGVGVAAGSGVVAARASDDAARGSAGAARPVKELAAADAERPGESSVSVESAPIPVASSRRARVGARLFGSRARAVVSASVAVLVIALVAGGAYLGVRAYADQRELAQAQSQFATAQADAASADELAADAQAKLAASVDSATKTAEEVSPALDAVEGAAPADQLAAARAALADLRVALAPTLGEPPEAYKAVAVPRDIAEARRAAQTAREHASAVSLAATDFTSADTKIEGARTTLLAALITLGAALPAAADGLLSENPLAEKEIQDAVTAAAVQVADAQNSGGTGAAELIAYAQAVAALRESQATQAEEQARSSRRSSGGSGGSGGSPSPSPTPTPTSPAPAPAPEPTVPAPQPSPTDPVVVP